VCKRKKKKSATGERESEREREIISIGQRVIATSGREKIASYNG